MNRKKPLLFTLILSLLFYSAFSQINEPLGTWRMYLPYGQSLGVCDAGDRVFSASHQSIFSCDKNTGEIRTYDKSSGLSDVAVKGIYYDPTTSALAVTYNNSNLDLIFNNTDVFNIPDIKKKAVNGAISINSVSFNNGNAYVSSDIGISVIDLAKKEISNTYIIGSNGNAIKVYATSFDNTYIYAATNEGVKYALLSIGNLLDFNSWALYSNSQIPAKPASQVAAYNNHVYAVIGGNGTDTLYEYDGVAWTKKYSDTLHTIKSLNVVNGALYFSMWNDNHTTAGLEGKIDASDSLVIRPAQNHVRPLNWFESNGLTWESDYWNGLFKNGAAIIPTGPFSASAFNLAAYNGILDVAPGGVSDSWDFNYNFDGFFMYNSNNNGWIYRNLYTNSFLQNFSDIICTAPIPALGKTYFGSFYSGLLEYDNASGNVTPYDQYNSILQGAIGDEGRTKISCLTVDQSNNLWIGNAGAPSLIKVIRISDGAWKKFTIPHVISLLKKMIIDQQGQIWALTRQTNGAVVYNYGTDMDDQSDDASVLLLPGAGAGGLPDENTFSLAEDLDGNIWVGTNQGIGIYYCPGSVIGTNGTPGCDASQIKVVAADGYVAYLFGTESVRAIAVDAANRKWIGTTNGVWLISADGQTQLLNFNSTNSPMPADWVTDIAIDNSTGEVYIGTIGGLVSYRGNAIGACDNCNDVLAYPNPVKPGYDGPVAIKGLTDNAYVKITDATGTLVFQGRANGTQMVWNAKNYNGVRVKTGIYLVFSSTDLGEEKKVTKILVMN